MSSELVEHFFRHEYGKLVATLSRQVGVQHVQEVEDAVQSALAKALAAWTAGECPEEPSAWLYQVARNQLLGALRAHSIHHRVLEQNHSDMQALPTQETLPQLAREMQDDVLRMLFVCCHEAISQQSQLVLALKTLCGFSVREIALRLFLAEDNVYKTLARARSRLRDLPTKIDLDNQEYTARLPALRNILYVLFSEGYLSSHSQFAIRSQLCSEAKRLTKILVAHPIGQTPESYALLALMYFHGARLCARQDGSGGLLLLEEQDRSLWDQQQIQEAMTWLAKSAQGELFTRYHAEASIAAEHCLAPRFKQTRWSVIAESYQLLEQVAPSAMHRLNRAVAVAEWQGASQGLALLREVEPPTWLAGSYMWSAVLSDLHRRNGDTSLAKRYRQSAISLAPSSHIKELLRRRLGEQPAS